jgi:F-type H+-transporting ATPase subunit b
MAILAGLILLPALSLAQKSSARRETETQEVDQEMKWEVINFALFVVLLGFGIAKTAPAFFNARSADIQKAIKDATGLKMEADLRYSEVDRKMANLAGEVEKIRAEAKVEMQREHDRLLNETKQELEHIRKNVAAEAEGLRQEGIAKVRRHTTHLALDLAERRLRDRFSAADSAELLHDFVNLVERGNN